MTTEYKLRKSRDGKSIHGCDLCSADAPTCMFCEGATTLLCKFCHETELGQVIKYPNVAPHSISLARGIAQAMNLVYWKDVPTEVTRGDRRPEDL